MTKNQTHIVRLLERIQRYCGMINFNTEHGRCEIKIGSSIIDIRLHSFGGYVIINKSVCYCSAVLRYEMAKSILYMIISELKEYYRMNRIIVKKGES